MFVATAAAVPEINPVEDIESPGGNVPEIKVVP